MKKVLIIAYYFPPLGWSGAQRTLKFVKYLRNFNWEPVVVTVGQTKFDVIDETLIKEIPKDIEIIRVDDVKFRNITDEIKEELQKYVRASIDIIDDNKLKELYQSEIENTLTTLRDLLLIPDGNAIWANKVIERIYSYINLKEIDMIYTTSAPYSSHIIGSYIKQKFHIPWVADFRDQWMNNPFSKIDINSLKYKVEKNMETTVVRNANKVIMTTPLSTESYQNIYCKYKEKFVTITNGYDSDDFKKIMNKKYKKNDRFTVVYNGSLYSEIKPYTFLEAVVNLIENRKLDPNTIRIIFNGKNQFEIEKKIEDMMSKYTNSIVINGYLPHSESLSIASRADMLIIILGKQGESKTVFPGKIFEYLALKKPIISIGPYESCLEKLLQETESGINIEYRDVKKIEKVILQLYNRWLNSEDITLKSKGIERYERKILTGELAKVFDEIIKG